jgi:hypothetical protein
MKTQLRALISIVAIVGLLAMVCAAWTKPAAAAFSELKPTQKISHVCSGAISNVRYLTEVRPRTPMTPGFLSSAIKTLLQSLTEHHSFTRFDEYAVASSRTDRPLWLINRALLI